MATIKKTSIRKIIGLGAAILSIALAVYVILLVVGILPVLNIRVLDYHGIRLVGAINVLCCLIAAYGLWEN